MEKNLKKIPNNKIMKIKINYGEIDLGRKVKSFGGIWKKDQRFWELSYEAVKALGLEDRIITDSEVF